MGDFGNCHHIKLPSHTGFPKLFPPLNKKYWTLVSFTCPTKFDKHMFNRKVDIFVLLHHYQEALSCDSVTVLGKLLFYWLYFRAHLSKAGVWIQYLGMFRSGFRCSCWTVSGGPDNNMYHDPSLFMQVWCCSRSFLILQGYDRKTKCLLLWKLN